MTTTLRLPDAARIALALIRLFNGVIALVAPSLLVRNLGVDAKKDPAILYVFRMFGMRTILVAIDLLRPAGDRRMNALRQAPLIHASDATAALIAALTGLPRRSGITIVLISSLNTVLAILAQPKKA